MKRFLAGFAMVAMLVSMFSGVAFAATTTNVYVQVDNNILEFGKDFHTVTLSGKIFNSTSNALTKVDATIEVFKGANKVASTVAKDGVFSLLIQTDSDDTGVADYTVKGVDGTGYAFSNGTVEAAADEFSIVYKTELTEDNALNFNFPVSGQQVVQGIFVNEDFDKTQTVQIKYQEGAFTPIEANFKNEKSFGFLFDGSLLTRVGKIGIYVNGVLAVEGEVKAGELNATLNTESVVKALGDQDLAFKFDLEDKYLNNEYLASGYKVELTIVDSDDVKKVDAEVVLNEDSKALTDEEKQELTYTADFTAWDKGSYTATLTLKNATTAILTKEFTFKVNSPDKHTLVGWNLKETNVGEVKIQLPKTDGTYSTIADIDEKIEVKKYASNTATNAGFVKLIVSGCGVDKEFASFGDDATEEATFSTTATGELKVTVEVYTDADDKTADFSKTVTVEVKGWNVEVTPNTAMVDVETEFTVIITDENGNPVNNAIVKAGTEEVVNGTTSNIVAGVYKFEKEYTDVAKITVEAYKGLDKQVTLTDAIDVKGEEVYTVTTSVPVVLNGLEAEMYVTVLDENGDVVYPSFERIDVKTVDGEDDSATGDVPAVSTRKDLDGDGVKEAIKVTVTPTKDQHTMILRASTDAGKKMGEVKIDVQKPQVVFTKGSTLTSDFETEVEFTVIDPRDNSIMTDDVEIDAVYLAGGSLDGYTDSDLQRDDDGVYTAKIKAIDVDYDKAEEDEKNVEVVVKMGEVELVTMPVEAAKLTATPEKVIINSATNVTLTYVDALGNPLAEREVKLGTDVIGETNEEGKVAYSTSSTSSLALTFNAETDVTNVYTTLKVGSAADTIAPVVSAPATTDGDTVVIKITDNVRVSRALVNGNPVDIYFPLPEVSFIANVKPGVNTFNVQAIDVNNNYVDTTVTVTVEKTVEPVTFTIGEATEYGTPELKSDVTMVPVRFAQDLGAKVEWNNATQTVTYSLGQTKIAMTLGSKTAVVNGVNTQLAVAPYLNEAGRTMVPLRMIAKELGFTVKWTSNDAPIEIK